MSDKMKSFNTIKQISFAMLLVLFLCISISSIQAVDVNDTIINSSEDIAISVDDDNQLEVDDDTLEQDTKNQTELVSPTKSMYYGGKYQVTLIDSNSSAALANKKVSFSINNVAYSANTNSKGIASVQLKLNPGTYVATAIFSGDDSFNASNTLSGKVKILTTIKAKDVSKYYKGSKKYYATYLNSNGNVLKNKKVTITVNGKKYTGKTNERGVAGFAIDFKPGTYKVTTTNPSTGQKLTTSFTILTTVTASDLRKVKGDSKKFVAKFLKKNGQPLAKTLVKVKINGKTYNYRTYSTGKIGLSFNNFKTGTYKVVCYNKDGLTKTNTVKVFKYATTKITTTGSDTFFNNETNYIKIKFSTSLNDNSKAGKVIEIMLDDKFYSKKTDSNGVINFKLPSLKPGIHSLMCDYNGGKFFDFAHFDKEFRVLNTSNTRFIADGTMPYGSFSGTAFSVVLAAGDVSLTQRTVTFNLNGKSFTRTTDGSGLASIPVSLDVGNYTVNYEFSGDSKLKASSGATDITVVERTNTTVTGTYRTSYPDSLQSFDVYLKDSNGTPIANEYLELVIGSQTYKDKTDANGHAVIKSLAPVGRYDFKIYFRGNNDYNSSFASGSTNVTLSKYANGVNEKNGAASDAYLKATRNCQVTNSKIKSMVKTLTKDLTNDIDKAKAIFDYVQMNIVYDYYYDTQKGAVKTLEDKKGNGADQAHLLVALYRAAGLKARYVHGYCTMNIDKKTIGHVWVQVLVDNTWICADTSEVVNRFGSIASWNVDSYTLINKYLELPF